MKTTRAILDLDDEATDHEAINAITAARAKLVTAQKALARTRTAYERTIAEAVSSEPKRIDWPQYPGYLTPEAVCGATGMTMLGLYKLMRRYGARDVKGAKR